MNYFVFTIATALVMSSFVLFKKNNQIATDNKNAIEVAKTVQELASIIKFENISNDKNMETSILKMSNYLANPRQKTNKNITVLNNLHEAMKIAIITNDDPNCEDLANTKKISLADCSYIISQNFDLYNIDDSKISIDSANQDQAYLVKAKEILRKNDFLEDGTTNTFASPKVSLQKLNQIAIKTKDDFVTTSKISKIISKDNTGESSAFMSQVAQQREYRDKNKISGLTLSRINKIEKEQILKMQNEAFLEAQTTQGDYDSILNDKLSSSIDNIKTNKQSIVNDIINSDEGVSKDVLTIASNSNLNNIDKLAELAEDIVYKVDDNDVDTISVYEKRIKKSDELIVFYDNEMETKNQKIETLKDDDSNYNKVANRQKILDLKHSRSLLANLLKKERKKNANYKNQL